MSSPLMRSFIVPGVPFRPAAVDMLMDVNPTFPRRSCSTAGEIAEGTTLIDRSLPSAASSSLWRRSFAPLFTGGAHLLTLGLAYLMLGHVVFDRGDA